MLSAFPEKGSKFISAVISLAIGFSPTSCAKLRLVNIIREEMKRDDLMVGDFVQPDNGLSDLL